MIHIIHKVSTVCNLWVLNWLYASQTANPPSLSLCQYFWLCHEKFKMMVKARKNCSNHSFISQKLIHFSIVSQKLLTMKIWSYTLHALHRICMYVYVLYAQMYMYAHKFHKCTLYIYTCYLHYMYVYMHMTYMCTRNFASCISIGTQTYKPSKPVYVHVHVYWLLEFRHVHVHWY